METTKQAVELRREVKKYYGVEYALILMCMDKEKYVDSCPPALGDVDPDLWWVVEYTKNSESLARSAQRGFLWIDTLGMRDARMQDKYNHCEMMAVTQINWLMGKYVSERFWWIMNEIKCFARVAIRTMPQRIRYRIKKLMGTQA